MTRLLTETSQPRKARAAVHAGYSRLPLSFFLSGDLPSLHVYSSWSDDEQPTLIGKSSSIQKWQLEEIRKAGHDSVYVRRDEFDQASRLLLDQLDSVLADDNYESEERFLILQTIVAREVESAFRSTNCDRLVSATSRIGAQIAKLVSQDDVTPLKLFDLAQHDTTTFVHATNVAAYATLLAEAMGVTKKSELAQIATGAMLHDLGKREIPQSILNKRGALTAQERELLEKHPQHGYEALYDRPEMSFGQLMMIYQHHEWIDGTGYPVRALSDEIHPWAKMVAVVDVFDALTSDRPYHVGQDHDQVNHMIQKSVGAQFDKEPVECWMSLFQA